MLNDDLQETAVHSSLSTAFIGRPYHYIREIGSTNDELKTWVYEGTAEHPPAGTVLLTDHQTSGRGRLGRRWEVPPGSSLLFSVLFRPGWPAHRSGWMTMIAGLALAEAVEAMSGITVGLKWPNDLMAKHHGQWRKFGGLLLDAHVQGDRLVWAVLGVGINVNVAIDELPETATPATSLLILTGHPIPRRPLLLECLSRLEHYYKSAERGRSPRPDWNERLITLGRPVSVSNGLGSPVIMGLAEGTDEWGRLLVRDDSGKLQIVGAGDVPFRSSSIDIEDKDD